MALLQAFWVKKKMKRDLFAITILAFYISSSGRKVKREMKRNRSRSSPWRERKNKRERKKNQGVSECRVTRAQHRCGASRLTSVLNSTKILNDASLWASPILPVSVPRGSSVFPSCSLLDPSSPSLPLFCSFSPTKISRYTGSEYLSPRARRRVSRFSYETSIPTNTSPPFSSIV